jgi:hypothetical protein
MQRSPVSHTLSSLTALDLAMCRGSIEDEELFLALSAL